MGFDTYLMVDGQVAMSWRKHASVLPRLLFRFDQLKIQPNFDVGDYPYQEVSFSATGAEALANLEEAGLGWHAAVAAYSETRLVGGYSSGMFMGHKMHLARDNLDHADLDRMVAAFEQLAPEVDLTNLGEAMVRQRFTQDDEPILLLSNLSEVSYDGSSSTFTEEGRKVLKAAEAAGVAEPFAAARAAESIALLDRSAPLLAWPLVVCIFLRHLPPDIQVVFDISEAALEYSDDGENEASAREYAAHYWASASESLADYAQLLGRLFAVLASSNSKLGRDFWFARAADLLGRIQTFPRDGDETSMRSRGDALEGLVDALIRTEEPELRVVEKNFRTAEEEIDLLLSNSLVDPFWIAQGTPLILVECKNWSASVGVPELRIFESKILDRGALCKVGIFVSMSGFTRPFLQRLKSFQASGGIIFAVDGSELSSLVASKTRLTDWLRGPGIRRSLGR